MNEQLLNELAEKLLDAYRTRLDAQRAYYGRAEERNEKLESAYVEADEEYERAWFLHYQALTLWSPHTDRESEHARVAAEVAAKQGWTL